MAVQTLDGSDGACLEKNCQAAGSGIDGRCLAHISEEALERLRSHFATPVDLDGRGARFDKKSLERLLDAIFSGSSKRCLGTVRFDGATFECSVDFDDTIFAGPVSFASSTFLGDARFGSASFSAEACFDGAAFKGQAWFVASVFRGPVSFCEAAFLEPAWFQRTEFESSARFQSATFSENASFVSARFLSAWSFARASFCAHALFDTRARSNATAWDGVRFGLEGETPPAARQVLTSPAAAVVMGGPARSRPAKFRARRRRLHSSALIPPLILALLGLTYLVILRPDGGVAVNSASPDTVVNSGPSDTILNMASPDTIVRGRPDAFAFLSVNRAGMPVRLNPCRPVRYVVNPGGAPSYWRDSLRDALAEVGSATGISFEQVGVTDESVIPLGVSSASYLKALGQTGQFRRSPFQPNRYGSKEWAPVLVQWANFGPRYEGANSVGKNEAARIPNEDGNGVVVSGVVIIAEDRSKIEQTATLMHEFAHLTGLAHVDDSDEVMAAVSFKSKLTWGAGDRVGLQKVGKEAGCLKTPLPS